jgi:hypothetical protein
VIEEIALAGFMRGVQSAGICDALNSPLQGGRSILSKVVTSSSILYEGRDGAADLDGMALYWMSNSEDD